MLDRVIFFTLLPYFYDILDIIKYDCSRKSAKEILFKIAATNRRRYRQFHGEEALPALLAYTGVVFRHIAPERFTPGDFEYAQQHLNITSFLYGLLRPLDAIRRYRLEGDAVLPGHDTGN